MIRRTDRYCQSQTQWREDEENLGGGLTAGAQRPFQDPCPTRCTSHRPCCAGLIELINDRDPKAIVAGHATLIKKGAFPDDGARCRHLRC